MPDFDTKTIPILDDIIENKKANTNTVSEQETASAEILKTDASTVTDNATKANTADFNQLDGLTLSDDKTIPDEHDFDEPVLNEAGELDQNTSAKETSKPPPTLEAVVEDVVKHLMPDLEQQLRFLVQQALEEKLPKKILRRISTDSNFS